jgi:hypothetical protein
MALQPIGKMTLKNDGGFVVQLGFTYRDEDGEKQFSPRTGDISLGFTGEADPGDLGVPDDTDVSMYAMVEAGNNNEATRELHYKKGDPHTAHYIISGTTINNDLGLTGISTT